MSVRQSVIDCLGRYSGSASWEYSRTSLSGHSEKWTHSLERTKLKSRIENPILIIHWQPPRTSEKRPPPNSEQRTLSLVPKCFCNVLLPPNRGHSGNHTLTLQPLPHLYLHVHACNSATPTRYVPCRSSLSTEIKMPSENQ